MKVNKTADLGDRVKDRVTGFSGIVVCKTRWLQGCDRLGVQPEKLDSGKPGDIQHFDVTAVDVLKAAVHAPLLAEVEKPKPAAEKPGGPRQDPSSRRRGE